MDKEKKILYLEDEHYLGRIVKESLSSRGYSISLITDGAKLLNEFISFKPNLCVLDIMVPNVDGYTLAKEIRKLNPKMPIIFLSAKTQTDDVIQGFKSGGNDFVKKPFSMEELILRIENLLSMNIDTHKSLDFKRIKLGSYEFDYERFQLFRENERINLSHRENELILLLSQHVNKKLDRREILLSLIHI